MALDDMRGLGGLLEVAGGQKLNSTHNSPHMTSPAALKPACVYVFALSLNLLTIWCSGKPSKGGIRESRAGKCRSHVDIVLLQ